MGEWRYRSTFSLPWRWMEVSGQFHAIPALPLGIHWTGGWVGPRAGREYMQAEKILDPTGSRSPTPRYSSPQPVAIPSGM
jgi:hypothetical protein